MIGTTLGHYKILRLLGAGGMGEVYAAEDLTLGRTVAVKILSAAVASSPADLDRFEREAKALAKLSHPNIVKVHDYGEHEGSPYIVMEYMPGGTLRKILGKPIPWQIALRLLLPVARGVEYAHQRGIVHRDIKPTNILITESGDPMLSDFGIAKSKTFADDEGEWLVGTPAYMSPEQAKGEHVDGRSDVYALGVTLYRILTGQLPFSSDSATSLINSHAEMPIPDVRSVKSNIPAVWQEVVAKAMAKDPKDRYATAGDFARDVNEVVSGKWFLRKL